MKQVLITDRAMEDLQEIYNYSLNRWGENTALQYIQNFETAFTILQEKPGLLITNKNISVRFKIYYVKKHAVICEVLNKCIFIITIKHTSINLLERLQQLEPQLEEEVKYLYKKLKS